MNQFTARGLPKVDAANYVGCGKRKFDDMVSSGSMPEPRMIGAKKVWDRVELDECFEALPRPDQENEWDGEGGD